jgi:hypothetical protein
MHPQFIGPASDDQTVIFLETPQTQPMTAASLDGVVPPQIKAAMAAAIPKIRVRVNKPYRVIHEGKVFLGGQTLTVPDDIEHSRWIQSGWVTKLKAKEK